MNPASWQPMLDELMGRVAARFGRVEPRRTARAFVTGLLSGAERKNCWWLAEWAGHRSPDAMQRLLRTARWDADLMRDDVRGYVAERLGHRDGVLIADETGFVKKGNCSAGVQRQYTGTAGRIENTQVGVFVAYVSPRGRALIDRALYLPRSWAGDPDRCRAAGVPASTVFASKPALARQMLARALDAGVPAAWVTADEVYGADPALRADLERRGTGYVLAVACHRRVTSGGITIRADELASRLPARAWQQLSAGPGAKGPRYYDWAWAGLDGRACRWLLIRRHPATGKLAFYLCWAPRAVPLATLVRVAGSRWAIEESFQAAKGQVGLDHYQVRGWEPWHRFATLAMLALAFLAVTAATTWPGPDPDPLSPHTCALSMAEIRHLLRPLLTGSPRQPAAMLAWPAWRRRPRPAPAAPTTSEDRPSPAPAQGRPLPSFHATVNGLRARTLAAWITTADHRHDRQRAGAGMRQDDRHGQHQAHQAGCLHGTRPHGAHDQGHPRRVTAADLAPPAGPVRHHPARPA